MNFGPSLQSVEYNTNTTNNKHLMQVIKIVKDKHRVLAGVAGVSK